MAEIKIAIDLDTDETMAQRYSLFLVIDDGAGAVVKKLLQTGYTTAEQALQAVYDCLTYQAPPPPDLSPLEAAAEQVSAIAVAQEEANDAIRILGERMNEVEDKVASITVAPPARGNSLLAGRTVAGAGRPAVAPAPPAPPSIRRQPLTRELPEQDQNLGDRVHGQMFGGPVRGRG